VVGYRGAGDGGNLLLAGLLFFPWKLALLVLPFAVIHAALNPVPPPVPGRSIFDPVPYVAPSGPRVVPKAEQLFLDWKIWRADAEARGLEIKLPKIYSTCVVFTVDSKTYAFPKKLPQSVCLSPDSGV
tara:strand:+ start:1634 stop:2017 length:384 start_codon:yes stop_codon:yes gene_type:complete